MHLLRQPISSRVRVSPSYYASPSISSRYQRRCRSGPLQAAQTATHAASFQALDDALNQSGPDGESKALDVVKGLQADGVLRGFGQGVGIPKRMYTLEELRLNKIVAEKLLSPTDKSLNFVRTVAQVAAAAGLGALALVAHFDFAQLGGTALGLTFLAVLDQVVNQGGGESLILDTLGRVLVPAYSRRVAIHESGHFLVAYLVGILPRVYTLSALDAYQRFGTLNIQAGTQFCDSAFTSELATGRLSSSSLDRYMCVALAGVVSEYVHFEQAEGGVGDLAQLDTMFRSLQFSQLKTDGEVRWAVLNVAYLLRNHMPLQLELAAAMQRGESVGTCIALIERHLSAIDV